jgi:tRNA threonylcarbamoyladenosine biosynthesis protein TsaE
MSVDQTLEKQWKKVRENDYSYIAGEIKATVLGPSIIFLEGEMGIGKTTFSRYFVGSDMPSPTYSIITEFKEFIHADFYRLKDKNELLHLDLETYLYHKEFFLAEWGLQYFHSLVDFMPEEFEFYHLLFEKEKDTSAELRDLSLYKIDPMLS